MKKTNMHKFINIELGSDSESELESNTKLGAKLESYSEQVFTHMHKQLLTGFRPVKKISSHFIDFRQVKKVISHFTDFEQVKRIVIILLNCF